MKKDWHELVSQPKYEVVLEEDVMVPMRDGVRLCVDIYRPKGRREISGVSSSLAIWKGYTKASN